MTNDTKELLRLAAKAAGYTGEVIFSGVTDECLFAFDMDTAKRTERMKWMPHEDDGDALRLAVALGLWVATSYCLNRTAIIDGDDAVLFQEPHSDDPLKATRLAIVRAAAAIGKATP